MRLSTILQHRFLVSIFAFLFFAQCTFAGVFEGGDATKGETLFKQNCASCHSVDGSLLAAPSLQGIDSRWAGKDALIVKWIQNPNGALATGDAYIVGMVAKWKGQFGMMAAQAVSEGDIKDIIAYVKTGGSAGGPKASDAPKCLTLEEIEAAKAELEGDDSGYVWFIIIGLILSIIAVSAANIKKSLATAVNERDGLPAPAERTYMQVAKAWMWTNKKFVSVLGFVIFCYISVVGYKSLMGIGVYQGYTPDQPIWFSHAIHACQNEIDCQYCHSSAAKSKHAGIPSVNVCMNCHKGIKKGAISGTKEISKIYEAIGFDADSSKYIDGYAQKPIAWNKVHNLPDHVYFSHQQHVTVGQIDCKQCHGPVQMYSVGHVATPAEINAQEDVTGLIKLEKETLTMGWCLECHNKAGIDPTKSEYYEEMHKRYKSNEVGKRTLSEIMEDGSMTVRENGGWECGKCHY
jgi:mono/diheme cytochrome c family protein